MERHTITLELTEEHYQLLLRATQRYNEISRADDERAGRSYIGDIDPKFVAYGRLITALEEEVVECSH
jgi:hypothetical protein